MADHIEYYKYLSKRSRIGHIYRKYFLYPRLNRRLRGLTLDIGCGIGDMLAFRPNTIGSDINPHTIKYCNDRGLDARLMSSGSLPFTDQQFDSVLLDNVIEHIEDPTFLLDEIFRVLKSDGILLVGVPGIRGWKSDSDHKIAYDVVNLVSLLSDSHFRRDEIFFTPLWESNWLSKNLKQYCIYGKFIKVNCERNC